MALADHQVVPLSDRVLIKDREDRSIFYDNLVSVEQLAEGAIDITCYIHWFKLLKLRGQIYTFHKKGIKGSVRQQVPDPVTAL
jgi:hypothetical protein